MKILNHPLLLQAAYAFTLFCVSLLFFLSPHEIEARKIRQTLKTTTATKNRNKTDKKDHYHRHAVTIELSDADSIWFKMKSEDHLFIKKEIHFTGYDKNATSAKESFHFVNGSRYDVKGFTIRVIYSDMQGRMLHSRDVAVKHEIPHEETRKIDISTWDTQNSFYYYLSNEPRRVASPYHVEIHLLKLVISDH